MTRLPLRPQPLGILPLPAGYLVLPASPEAAAARDALLRGEPPTGLPPALAFYGLAAAGDTPGALAALAGDESPEARYNRFVLAGDPAAYGALAPALTGDLALLTEIVAYTLGLREGPPDPGEAEGEVLALALMAVAAEALEGERFAEAEAALRPAVDAAREASPLLAGQLLATLAEARLARLGPDALAVTHYREALALLRGPVVEAARGQVALNVGILYQEMARGQRAPLLEAARYYQEALRVFTRERYPELYALAQNNLALAYLAMPLAEASDQLRKGIAVQALREALQVYTSESHPEQWASARLNLANALQYLPTAHPENNLTEAVEIYEGLLAVRDPAGDPLGYARILANQANALAHLGIFAHATAKLQEAGRLFAANGDAEAAAAVAGLLEEVEAAASPMTGD